ncbi:MAG: calcium-binding protein [Shinella sp.]|uniref:calcium-binding protein n=1 Tax=Shinella sp. TaxID=1870904 RepID=UPI004035C797
MAPTSSFSFFARNAPGETGFHIRVDIPTYTDPETGEDTWAADYEFSLDGQFYKKYSDNSDFFITDLVFTEIGKHELQLNVSTLDSDWSFPSMGFYNGRTYTRYLTIEMTENTDFVFGGNQGNQIFTFDADDFIYGGSDDDTIDGGAGADRMEGYGGDDQYVVDNAYDKVIEAAGGGIDVVETTVSHTLAANIEHLQLLGTRNLNGSGNSLSNILAGNSANNTLDGKVGADTMYGDAGNDTFIVDNAGDKVVEDANDGSDLVKSSISHTLAANVENLTLIGELSASAAGNSATNVLTGNPGNNRLDGKAGNDTLSGASGNDKLIGGAGADKLYGGAGADTFVFQAPSDSSLSARDMIYDFSRVGGDKIDLSLIDARTATSGNQAFTFIGSDLFSKSAGELRYSKISGDTYIYGDVNGDGGIDFSIRLDAAINMLTTDFIL